MVAPDHLHILWANADPVTTEKMVFMYAFNALKNGWWKRITIIVWGATTKLAAEDQTVRAEIRRLREGGVEFSACKSCADQLGGTEALEELGVEVIYWGEPLTRLLKERASLLTV